MHLFNLKVDSNVFIDYYCTVVSSIPLAPGVILKRKKRDLCYLSMSCAIKIISLLDLKDWTTVFKGEAVMAAHIIKPLGSQCCEL